MFYYIIKRRANNKEFLYTQYKRSKNKKLKTNERHERAPAVCAADPLAPRESRHAAAAPRLPRVFTRGERRGVTHVAVVLSTNVAGTTTGGNPPSRGPRNQRGERRLTDTTLVRCGRLTRVLVLVLAQTMKKTSA